MKKKKIKSAAIILLMMVAVNLLGQPERRALTMYRGADLITGVVNFEFESISRGNSDESANKEHFSIYVKVTSITMNRDYVTDYPAELYSFQVVDKDGRMAEYQQNCGNETIPGYTKLKVSLDAYTMGINKTFSKTCIMQWELIKGKEYFLICTDLVNGGHYKFTVPKANKVLKAEAEEAEAKRLKEIAEMDAAKEAKEIAEYGSPLLSSGDEIIGGCVSFRIRDAYRRIGEGKQLPTSAENKEFVVVSFNIKDVNIGDYSTDTPSKICKVELIGEGGEVLAETIDVDYRPWTPIYMAYVWYPHFNFRGLRTDIDIRAWKVWEVEKDITCYFRVVWEDGSISRRYMIPKRKIK